MSELLKRTFDLILACLGLLVLWPVILILACLVKMSSPGPVIYRGLRTGRNGKPFRIFKFRSMVSNGEQCGGTTTGKNDPRITPIGLILRKYKLDELPQLLNVLLGDMSFVGPRPEVSEYTDLYSAEERRILCVRPGITDLASIEFSDLQEFVGSKDPDRAYREWILPRKNQLRLRYADEHTFWLDLQILAKTIWLVLYKPLAVPRALSPERQSPTSLSRDCR